MNLKIVKADLNRGIIKRKNLYIAILLVIVFLGIITVMMVENKIDSGRYNGQISLGDIILLFYKGSLIVNPNNVNSFYISEQYLFMSLCIIFAVGNYAQKDIYGIGMQVIVRCQKIKQWYLSKIIWCIVNSIAINIAIIVTLVILCLLSRYKLTFGIHEELLSLCGFEKITVSKTVETIFLIGVIIPFLSTMAIMIIQMVLSLVLSPVISILFVVTETVATVFSRSSIFLSNGLMCRRNANFYPNGTSSLGIMVCAIIEIAIALVVGYIYLNKTDMMSEKES